jgi:hypothetical protein
LQASEEGVSTHLVGSEKKWQPLTAPSEFELLAERGQGLAVTAGRPKSIHSLSISYEGTSYLDFLGDCVQD